MKKLKCEVCDTEFIPTTKDHYTAATIGGFFPRTEAMYDAFDCPQCGSQIIAKERRKKIDERPETETEEEDGIKDKD